MLRLLLIGIVGSVGASAYAQDPQRPESYSPARPVTRPNAQYPLRALQRGQEGWVTLSFVVMPNGEITETMIEDSSGNPAFESAARTALRSWQYEPARRDGQPVEEAMMRTTVCFTQSGARGADRSFRNKYAAVMELLQAGDAASAAEEIEALDGDEDNNLYEDAWLSLLKFYYLDAVKSPDSRAQIRMLQRSMGGNCGNGAIYLDAERFVAASRRLYALHGQRGEFGSAVETFERLTDTEGARGATNYEEALVAMRPTYERIMAAVATEQQIVVKGEIDVYYYWIGRLLRRSFSLESVVGRIDTVDIRCKTGTTRVGFTSEEQVWTVPASWAPCRVYIKGEPGTTFSLREHPLSFTAEQASPL